MHAPSRLRRHTRMSVAFLAVPCCAAVMGDNSMVLHHPRGGPAPDKQPMNAEDLPCSRFAPNLSPRVHLVVATASASRRNPQVNKDGSLRPAASRPLPPGMRARPSPRLEPMPDATFAFDRSDRPEWCPPLVNHPAANPGETTATHDFRRPRFNVSSPREMPTRYGASPRTKSTVGDIIFSDEHAAILSPRRLPPVDPFASSTRRPPSSPRLLASLANSPRTLSNEQQAALLEVARRHEKRMADYARRCLATKLRGACFVPPDRSAMCHIVD